jgi:hypothetical protein
VRSDPARIVTEEPALSLAKGAAAV